VYEERVFDDTDYTVCAFSYVRRESVGSTDTLSITFMPSGQTIDVPISEKCGWVVGESFYEECIGSATVSGTGRVTIENIECEPKSSKDKSQNMRLFRFFLNDFSTIVHTDSRQDQDGCPERRRGCTHLNRKAVQNRYPIKAVREYVPRSLLDNIILINAIDTGTADGMLGLRDIREECRKSNHPDMQPILVGLDTSRNLAHVWFDDPPSISDQERIIVEVNERLAKYREKYHSMFLTTYRNSTGTGARKRIGFDMMYKMINRVISDLNIQRRVLADYSDFNSQLDG
jgi:hypothetical protein